MTKVIHIKNSKTRRAPLELTELLEDFLLDIKSQGKSAATARAYRNDLHDFLAAYKGSAKVVTAQVLRGYLGGLEGVSLATRARRRAALRSFFSWLVDAGHLDSNPAERLPKLSLPERQPRAMAEADVWKVLRNIGNERDRLIFYLMAETGMRVSEALSIRLEKIRLHAQEISVIGKGNRERTAYLIKTESLGLLRRYLRAHGWLAKDGETITVKGLLFRPDEAKQRSGRAGDPIHYTVIQKAWKRYVQAAGVEATIHQLRHTYATKLVNEGKPIEVVQKVLGHRNLQTTMRYAVVSDDTVRRALEGE